MTPASPVVTRFAPSPTGYLHVGGARTALFNWLLARRFGGTFLLRIEDTDLARSTDASVTAVLDDLQWLGLHHDNPVVMFQSKRTQLYDGLIDGLIEKGLAYKAYETAEELAAQRRQAERAKRAYLYKRPALSDEQIAAYEAEGRPAVVRFAMPSREFRFRDEVLDKDIVLAASQVQDFVIRKTDGMPTYHFGVVVDDAEMGITHVLRGQEHLLNTVNHIALQDALGYPRPLYGHLPVILNSDGSKMSKRDRDKKLREGFHWFTKNISADELEDLFQEALKVCVTATSERLIHWSNTPSVQLNALEQQAVMKAIGVHESDLPEVLIHQFRKNGYLPETLNNFLALLGWSPGGDLERMSVDQMIEKFDLSGVGKSAAKFDRAKLTAFSTEAFAAAQMDKQVAAMRDFLSVNPDSPLNRATDAELADVLAMNAGYHVLREVEEKSRFFFVDDDQIAFDPKGVEKFLLKNDRQGLDALRHVRAALEEAVNWTAVDIEGAIKSKIDELGLGLGKVAQPARLSVCGGTVSPPIFDTLAFLGRDRTLRRIDRCLATFG